jgi:hypothetical protein
VSFGPLARVLIRAACRRGTVRCPLPTLFFLPAGAGGRVLKSDRRGRGPANSRGKPHALARRRFAPSLLLALAVEVAAARPARASAERKTVCESVGSDAPEEELPQGGPGQGGGSSFEPVPPGSPP